LNAGQRVTYWREEPLEVDGILEGTWGAWAIEVKTGAVTTADLRGLGEFTRRHPKYEPLVLCDDERRSAVERLGLRAMAWQEYLLGAPAARG
jgi:hypothetical protein